MKKSLLTNTFLFVLTYIFTTSASSFSTLANTDQLTEAKTALENIRKVDPYKKIIEAEQQVSQNNNQDTTRGIGAVGELEEGNSSIIAPQSVNPKAISNIIENTIQRVVIAKKNLNIVVDKVSGKIQLLSQDDTDLIDNKAKPIINIPKLSKDTNPVVLEDKVIYSNPNSDTIIEPVGGGVRQLVHIKTHNAPKYYDFPVELKDGQILELNNEGSGATVKDDNDEAVLTIVSPWAKDADGNSLDTYYTVEEGNILRQHIEFDSATSLPIVADPTWCGSQIHSSTWKIDEIYPGKNDWSMNVVLSWCGKASVYSQTCIIATKGLCTSLVGYNTWDAWTEAYDKAGEHERFKNRQYGSDDYWKMHDQFVCHYVNPATWFKDSYNLDPWRKHVGMIQTYKYWCNPPIDENY